MQLALLCGILSLGCSQLFASQLSAGAQLLAGGGIAEAPPEVNREARPVESLTLRASEILPQHVLSGPNHEVIEFVPVELDRCHFTVRTEWGQFTAIGKPMLELRLREIAAIDLSKSSSDNPSTNGLPVVPVSSVRLKSGLSNPRGRLLQPQKSVDLGIDLPGTTAASHWGSPELRRVAFEIGCDPETSQPLVYEALEALSKREDIADLLTGSRRGVSPFPTSLLSIPGDQQEMLASRKLDELQTHFEQTLAETGVDPETGRAFSRQLPLTSCQKWLLIRELQALKQIPGSVDLFKRLLQAPDELAALEILQELRQANNLHARQPLKELQLTKLGTELHTQRGEIALVRLGDYLTGNPPFQQEMEQLRATHPKDTLLIITPAQVSPPALKVLQNNKIKVFAK